MVIVSFEFFVYIQRVRDLGTLNGMSPSNPSPRGSSNSTEEGERLLDPEGQRTPRTLSLRDNRTEAHTNWQRLRKQAQGLHSSKLGGVSVLRGK